MRKSILAGVLLLLAMGCGSFGDPPVTRVRVHEACSRTPERHAVVDALLLVFGEERDRGLTATNALVGMQIACGRLPPREEGDCMNCASAMVLFVYGN